MTANKTQASEANVEEFLDGLSEEQREDCRLLAGMMHAATQDKAVMWGESMVGFGQYHYRYASGREGDFFLTGFAPRKRNLSIYIVPGFERYEKQLAQLGKHKLGRSCLYIKRLADIELKLLDEIIRDSVAVMRERYPD